MILPVHVIGSSVLRKVAQDVSSDYPGLKELIENMLDTMHSSDGVGLAAPQVGKSVRIFVIDGTPMAEDEPELDGFKRTFINAHITERKGEPVLSTEGCLSIPDIREEVLRFPEVTVEYVNENFEPQKETFKGMAAVIVQHEYDHLDGILFTDKVSALRKKFLKKKLENIAKGVFKKRYRVVLGEKFR
jgi:peptide deformylase